MTLHSMRTGKIKMYRNSAFIRWLRVTAVQFVIVLILSVGDPLNFTLCADQLSPPNFLFIFAEDISTDIGPYGDTYARTPTLDRLATEGRVYRNCFSVSGVCAPSRSGIITGMYPTTIGTHHMRSKGVPPSFVKCFTEYLRAAGYYCTNNSKTDYNFDSPITAWDESGNKAHWRNRAEGQPFYASFTIVTTHESQIRTSDEDFARNTARVPTEHRHDPALATLPPYYPDDPAIRRDWARYHDLITAMDLKVADLLAELEADGLVENTVVVFIGDNGRGLPRGKRWMYDSGIHVPLIVRWPGKVAAGSVSEELMSFLDFAPTFISLAGTTPPEHLQGRVFLGENVNPEPQFVFAARDRTDEIFDRTRAVRDRQFKYIRNLAPEVPYDLRVEYAEQQPTMQALRRLHAAGELSSLQESLLFAQTRPPEELYDCATDPHEVRNLADDPEHSERLATMRTALDEWMTCTGDLGAVPEEELKQRVRPGGVWQTTATPSFQKWIFPGGSVAAEIHCETGGASIAWTTDSVEKAHWRLYTGMIPLFADQTIRARAIRLGYHESPEATLTP